MIHEAPRDRGKPSRSPPYSFDSYRSCDYIRRPSQLSHGIWDTPGEKKEKLILCDEWTPYK